MEKQIASFRADESEALVRQLLNRPLRHLSKRPLNPTAGRHRFADGRQRRRSVRLESRSVRREVQHRIRRSGGLKLLPGKARHRRGPHTKLVSLQIISWDKSLVQIVK